MSKAWLIRSRISRRSAEAFFHVTDHLLRNAGFFCQTVSRPITRQPFFAQEADDLACDQAGSAGLQHPATIRVNQFD